MTDKTTVSTQDAPAAIGPYSQAVEANGFLFISGQIPIDPQTGHLVEGGIQPSTDQVMRNLEAVLKAAGLDFSNIVKTTVYLADMTDFAAVNEVYATHFTDNPPARACVEVATLPKGVSVEIDAIAVTR